MATFSSLWDSLDTSTHYNITGLKELRATIHSLVENTKKSIGIALLVASISWCDWHDNQEVFVGECNPDSIELIGDYILEKSNEPIDVSDDFWKLFLDNDDFNIIYTYTGIPPQYFEKVEWRQTYPNIIEGRNFLLTSLTNSNDKSAISSIIAWAMVRENVSLCQEDAEQKVNELISVLNSEIIYNNDDEWSFSKLLDAIAKIAYQSEEQYWYTIDSNWIAVLDQLTPEKIDDAINSIYYSVDDYPYSVDAESNLSNFISLTINDPLFSHPVWHPLSLELGDWSTVEIPVWVQVNIATNNLEVNDSWEYKITLKDYNVRWITTKHTLVF